MSYRACLLALVALFFAGERSRTSVAESPSPLRALRFEAGRQGGFVARTQSSQLQLDEHGASLAIGDTAVSFHVANARSVSPVAEDPLATRVSYLVGPREQWRRGLPTFGKVVYRSVLDGVDLVFHGEEGQLEYDFIVAPGVDPQTIALDVRGGHGVSLTAQGDLAIATPSGTVLQKRPRVYQGPREIASSYRLRGDLIAFEIGAYDRSQPLVIDPVIQYSTSLDRQPVAGGFYTLDVLTVVAGGYAYAAGVVGDFPPLSAHTIYPPGPAPATRHQDIIVTKIDPDGNVIFTTVYGGNDDTDLPRAITADENGRVYIGGWTRSTDIVTTSNALKKTASYAPSQGQDGILFTLTADGTNLEYATRLDFGTNTDLVHTFDCPAGTCAEMYVYNTDVRGIAAINGRVFLTGNVRGPQGSPWVTVPGPSANTVPVDATRAGPYIAEVTVPENGATPGAFVRKKLLGGNLDSAGNAIVASADRLFVGGKACASLAEGITAGSFQPAKFNVAGNCDGFVTMYDHGLTSALWGSYAGAQGNADTINALALDPSSSGAPVVYAAGTVNGQYQVTYGSWGLVGASDAMFLKLAPAVGANGLVWSRLVSGNGADTGTGVGVDASGRPWFTGATSSTDFETIPLLPNTTGLASQAYVMELTSDGVQELFGAHYGKTTTNEQGTAIRVTATGVFFSYNDPDDGEATVVRLIEPPMTLVPVITTVHPGETVQFKAAGGLGTGYSYTFDSKASGPNATLNVISGFYTAGDLPGIDVIRATDAEGHSVTAQAQVVPAPPPEEDAGPPVTSDLVVTPLAATVAPKQSLVIKATGGAPPYQFALIANASNGQLSSAGQYVAGTRGSVTDRVRVTDSAAHAAVVTISVSPGITISPSTASIAQNAKLKLTATGGKGEPYTWSTSAGTITASGDFTAPLQHIVVQVSATDALGNTASVPVAVGEAIAIAPLDPQTYPHGTVQFSAFGGAGGYKFSLITDPPAGGQMTSETGIFTANTVGNASETVQVSDTANRHASTTVTIGPSLTMAPTEATAGTGERVQFAAAGGSGVGYTFTLATNASGGSIDPSSGTFTAGPNAGVDVVRLADNAGNEARATITVTASPAPPAPPTGAASSSSGTTKAATSVGGSSDDDSGCSVSSRSSYGGELLALLVLVTARARRRRSRTE